MDIQGRWNVRYAARTDEVFVNEDGDPDEVGEVRLKDGQITGRDPFGANYLGTYEMEGSNLNAKVVVSSTSDDHPFIFEGVSNPFEVELTGQFTSPDVLSMRGSITKFPKFELVVNCRRIG